LEQESAYGVLAKAQQLERQGKDIVHFEIGQPDFKTFPNIAKRLIGALREGKTGYKPPKGILELREAIADHAGKLRGITIDPE